MEETFMSDTIAKLENLYAYRDLLGLKMDQVIRDNVPAEILQKIEEIKSEFSASQKTVDAQIEFMEKKAKAEAITAGSTIQGSNFMVVYSPGGKMVTVDDVLMLATRWRKTNPEVANEIESIVTLKKSSASIRPKGK
jgi:hypothetical protein